MQKEEETPADHHAIHRSALQHMAQLGHRYWLAATPSHHTSLMEGVTRGLSAIWPAYSMSYHSVLVCGFSDRKEKSRSLSIMKRIGTGYLKRERKNLL